MSSTRSHASNRHSHLFGGRRRQRRSDTSTPVSISDDEDKDDAPRSMTVDVVQYSNTSKKRPMKRTSTHVEAVVSPKKKARGSEAADLGPDSAAYDDAGVLDNGPLHDVPVDAASYSLDGEELPYTTYTQEREQMTGEAADQAQQKQQYSSLETFIRFDREIFLHETIRQDGRGDYIGIACRCGAIDPDYRCEDGCFGGEMKCKGCMLDCHKQMPFHRIKRWSGITFEKVSLMSLGLRVQLGHVGADACPAPKPAREDSFTVIDSNGIHDVALDFCDCEHAQPGYIQLLRARLYPATSTMPRTAATFAAMCLYQSLNFEAKTSSFQFHSAITALTDNSGVHVPKDVYDQLRLMLRTWTNLKLLKHGGRGHAESGIQGTVDGELALRCPACPQPGRNMPSGWKTFTSWWIWIFALFVAIDANFKTKRKKVSDTKKDPSLSNGAAYFVNQMDYQEHLESNRDVKQERSTCVNHNAVNNADSHQKDMAITGTVTCDCARHDMKRPNGCGALHAGERYLNTDFCFLTSIQHTPVLRFVISYDIACQWSKNLFKRMEKYSPKLQFIDDKPYLVFLIPKFHLPAHIRDCHILYSFHLKTNVAMTDGEGVERAWSSINDVAPQAKEMGPGAWLDTMNNHYGAWNWRKIIRLGGSLLQRLEKALPQRLEHLSEFRAFDTSIENQSDVAIWKEMIEAFESGRSKENPYRPTTNDPTLQDVRKKLAEMEAEEASKEGLTGVDLVAVELRPSASEFIAKGLQLEEDQRRIAKERADLPTKPTNKMIADFQLTVNRLQARVDAFISTQAMLMPEVTRLRAHSIASRSSSLPPVPAYETQLWLPSALVSLAAKSSKERAGAPHTDCLRELKEVEWKMREGQAYDSLHEVRNNLRVRSHAYKHKDRYTTGVHASIKINQSIEKVQSRIDACAETYRRDWVALSALSGNLGIEGWNERLRNLERGDIRGMTEGNEGQGTSKKSTSWIWLVEGVADQAGNDAGLHEALRIEWCRSRARAMRWSEEVELVPEEMRRVDAYLLWEAERWAERAESVSRLDEIAGREIDKSMREGMVAYARRQESQRLQLRDRFRQRWAIVPCLLRDNYTTMSHTLDIGKDGWKEEDCEIPFVKVFLNALPPYLGNADKL